MSSARAIIEAESPKKAMRHMEHSIEHEMRFGDVPEGAVYFNPFPNGVTGTIERKLPGWNRLGGYGYALWVGRINSKGQRELLNTMRINKSSDCRCFPVPKTRFAEAESPKKALRAVKSLGLNDRLDRWIHRTFFVADRLLMKRPFNIHPAYGQLRGRFWYQRVHLDTHGPTVLTCVLTLNGHQFAKGRFEFHPVEGTDADMINILNPIVEEVQWAAMSPPDYATAEERRYWLQEKVQAVFEWARGQYENLQNQQPGLWAI